MEDVTLKTEGNEWIKPLGLPLKHSFGGGSFNYALVLPSFIYFWSCDTIAKNESYPISLNVNLG